MLTGKLILLLILISSREGKINIKISLAMKDQNTVTKEKFLTNQEKNSKILSSQKNSKPTNILIFQDNQNMENPNFFQKQASIIFKSKKSKRVCLLALAFVLTLLFWACVAHKSLRAVKIFFKKKVKICKY